MSPHFVRVPTDRIGVLIGEGGEVRDRLEEITGLTVDIDSETGDVEIQDRDVDDPLLPLKAADFVKAVGRGFNPDIAFRLIEEHDAYLDILDLTDWVGSKANQLRRVKGRIIGQEGKTRTALEEYTGCKLAIYGKTVSMIGDDVEIRLVRDALEMLIEGAPHSAVYKHLDERLHDLRMQQLGL